MTRRGTARFRRLHGPSGTPRIRPRARGHGAPPGRSPRRCPRAPACPRRRCRVLLATLHEKLERPLVCLLPEDADARDAAEAAAWFLGDEQVGFLPEPRRQLGVRPRAAAASRRRARPRARRARARRARLRLGARARRAAAAAAHAARADRARARARARRRGARRSRSRSPATTRVDRVDDRGQFAVRGGIVDVFPTTGREPLRIEFFGDEIESIRAFSSFTQRALHPVEDVHDLSRRRAAPRPHARTGTATRARFARCRTISSPPLDRAPDFVFQPDDVRRIWEEDKLAAAHAEGRDGARPVPAERSRSRSRRSGPRSPRAGSPRRRTSSPRSCARASASSSRSRTAARRCARRTCCARSRRGSSSRATSCPPTPGLFFAIAPARRGFVWRDLGLALLPDHQVFRRRVSRQSAPRRPRAAVVRRPAHRRLRRPRGPRRRQAARLRDEGGRGRHARLPPARVPRRRPPLRPARAARQGLALRRRRREGARALEARRQGVAAAQVARARIGAGARGRADRALRAAADARGHRVRPRARVARSGSRRRSRIARRPTRRTRSRR